MRDLPRDLRSPAEVAWMRIAESTNPDYFQAVLGETTAALEKGSDLAVEAWTADDPVRLAAEIESLAGARRINTFRKDGE
ncbi:hypothetical protein [Streptomyces sp. NBC_00120]|uniref:hypothetical protein n=1 Tax=Streptomyces sp. NBC_00120 TaxID=2975660 RepID=UPI00225ABF3E|nr:hypothetical protein [Streptomyces sp. NBC_00120]MCX5326365.1 hypothetical protein [Streptomyces sp. NBC_00120]